MYKYEVIGEDKILRKYGKRSVVLSKAQVECQLSQAYQIRKLLKEGFVQVREIRSNEVQKVVEQKKQIKEVKKQKKQNKVSLKNLKTKRKEQELLDLIDKAKLDYRSTWNRKKERFELSRKNPRGFFNFVSYFDDKIQEVELIQKDIAEQYNLKLAPKPKKDESEDDDI